MNLKRDNRGFSFAILEPRYLSIPRATYVMHRAAPPLLNRYDAAGRDRRDGGVSPLYRSIISSTLRWLAAAYHLSHSRPNEGRNIEGDNVVAFMYLQRYHISALSLSTEKSYAPISHTHAIILFDAWIACLYSTHLRSEREGTTVTRRNILI